jgi:gamma-glutamylputrescine oxidase
MTAIVDKRGAEPAARSRSARLDPRGLPVIEPYWLWSRPALAPLLPSLPTGISRVDVAVIGGGLAGLSTAYHLLQRMPGLRLCLLEADRLGAGASGRSTGMLSPGVGQSLPALVRRLGAHAARALYLATLDAVRSVADLAQTLGMDCDLRLGGQVLFARSPGQQRRLAQQAALLHALDLASQVQILDEDALQARLRLPRLGRSDAKAGPAALRFPTAGTIDPLRLIVGLSLRVQAQGGCVYERARVLDVDGLDGSQRDRSGPVRIRLAQGQVLADQVVLATAGFAPTLGLLRGRLLPVQLQAIVSEPIEPDRLRALGWDGCDGFLDARRVFSYFRLTADRRIVFGGARPRYGWGGRDGGTASLQAALAQVAAELQQIFPGSAGVRPEGGWGGTIGYVLDALPLIGRLPQAPRIWHAVGWCGHGVALATAAGAWLAQAMAGDPLPDLPWFRSQAPLVPTELGRYLGFSAVTRLMSLQDRVS